ncbi:hypothetical protein CC78DRAFT_555519 [Lojkania enalia]|uniref:DUF4396 domain-containing protein n=1 Tax=Lojkania enalia TaxID=147567 RepID=A0A9P4N3A5_9PLEO|nr:hypothetical protein CC78DRAFT_555519 [Didymosphaeria enalia]
MWKCTQGFALASRRPLLCITTFPIHQLPSRSKKTIPSSVHLGYPPMQQRGQCSKSREISYFDAGFWISKLSWKRASVNTFRCLVGCTMGDFSALWTLQAYCPTLGVGAAMAISMASGLTSSMLLETVLLRLGKDQLTWRQAATTAAGMSLVSMLAMESVQNVVDYHLTGGMVNLQDPGFWAAAGISITAGFFAALPYNYARLRKYGKACH